MSVKYILEQVGNKTGLSPLDSSQRATMLRWLNEAAPELYEQSDMPNSLIEQVFRVNGDQTIALPYCVGELRAVREFYSRIPWHINQMRPRYNQSNWPDMWRNWRLKGEQALQKSITNQSIVTVTVPVVETPNIVVSIAGPTLTAAHAIETLTMDSVSKSATKNFLDIVSVTKDRVNDYDVTVSDVDDVVLTIIPNNQLEARYLIVDISTLPWSTQPSSQQDHYVEVLYKKALSILSNDADEFPARGYDNVLVNKCLQLWMEEQGKVDGATMYDSKATRTLARKNDDRNKATEDMVSFVTNPHDELLGRLRGGGIRRYPSIYPLGM